MDKMASKEYELKKYMSRNMQRMGNGEHISPTQESNNEKLTDTSINRKGVDWIVKIEARTSFLLALPLFFLHYTTHPAAPFDPLCSYCMARIDTPTHVCHSSFVALTSSHLA
jgi:hypothetical protein